MVIAEPGKVYANQTLLSPVEVVVPGVRFYDCRFEGIHRDHMLLRTGPATLIDHCTFEGHPSGQRAGVAMNSANVIMLNSQIRGIWHDVDAQAFGGIDGGANIVVDGCYLEGAGENVLFGGGDPLSESGIPRDIIIRRCVFTKPLYWRDKPGYNVKNLLELKNAKRVLIEDCDFSFSWVDDQDGWAVLFTVRNQNNKAPFSTIEDVTMRRNHFRHMAGGINILSKDNIHPSQMLKRLTIQDNVFEDINTLVWGKTGRNNGRVVQIGAGGEDISIIGNSFSGTSTNSFLYLYGSPEIVKLTVKNNIADQGAYGIFGDGGLLGKAAIDKYAPGYVWENNTIRKGDSPRTIKYPDGTTVIP